MEVFFKFLFHTKLYNELISIVIFPPFRSCQSQRGPHRGLPPLPARLRSWVVAQLYDRLRSAHLWRCTGGVPQGWHNPNARLCAHYQDLRERQQWTRRRCQGTNSILHSGGEPCGQWQWVQRWQHFTHLHHLQLWWWWQLAQHHKQRPAQLQRCHSSCHCCCLALGRCTHLAGHRAVAGALGLAVPEAPFAADLIQQLTAPSLPFAFHAPQSLAALTCGEQRRPGGIHWSHSACRCNNCIGTCHAQRESCAAAHTSFLVDTFAVQRTSTARSASAASASSRLVVLRRRFWWCTFLHTSTSYKRQQQQQTALYNNKVFM